MDPIEVDYMEYANDAAAQAAYMGEGFVSRYPAQDDAHVKATTKYSTSYWPYFTTDPAKSLVGSPTNNQWTSQNAVVSNQRFHIDLGAAKVIKKIYYENGHNTGGSTNQGAKNFTFWGSNSAAAFADTEYTHDTDWTELTCSQGTLDIHVTSNVPDPKYIDVTNITPYRYYAFKFADNWGATTFIGVRRIELQSLDLEAFSEAALKTQGSYALKGIGVITDSLNKTLIRTVSPVINLTDKTIIKLDIRASRTGSHIKIGIHDSGGVTTEITPNIVVADTYQMALWDLSGVANADKDAVNQIIITIVNADADNTFYLDNMFAHIIENFLIHRGRDRFRFKGYSLG